MSDLREAFVGIDFAKSNYAETGREEEVRFFGEVDYLDQRKRRVSPGDRVKTNHPDAISLARLLRAGELIAVWVLDEGHEVIRDLVRARAAAVETLRVHRQHVSAFMPKHGRL